MTTLWFQSAGDSVSLAILPPRHGFLFFIIDHYGEGPMTTNLQPVSFFFTLKGNARSEAVLIAMKNLRQGDKFSVKVFASKEEMADYFGRLSSLFSRSVMLCDGYVSGGRRFHPSRRADLREAPEWAVNTEWAVVINRNPSKKLDPVKCARQQIAGFVTHFNERIANDQMPWGEKPQPALPNKKRPRRRHMLTHAVE